MLLEDDVESLESGEVLVEPEVLLDEGEVLVEDRVLSVDEDDGALEVDDR